MPAHPDLLIAVAPLPASPDASAVLAVTAAAVATLADVGVRYAVVDDVIDRADVLGADEEYVRWQLDWFGRLDDTIGAAGAAVASAQKLKPVIDSVIIAARLAAAAIDRLGPDGIELVVPSGAAPLDPLHDGHLQFWPRLGDLPLWSTEAGWWIGRPDGAGDQVMAAKGGWRRVAAGNELAGVIQRTFLLARAEARHKTVEAKSIFGVLLLAATKGTEIEIICEGTDEAAALEAICQLIESKFGEE